jgi:hypothetical protein
MRIMTGFPTHGTVKKKFPLTSAIKITRYYSHVPGSGTLRETPLHKNVRMERKTGR